MKTTIKPITETQCTIIDLGISDHKNRAIGLQIRTRKVMVTEISADQTNCSYHYMETTGEHIEIQFSVTRDRFAFGATQLPAFYSNQEKADAAIENKIKTTKQRYEKQLATH